VQIFLQCVETFVFETRTPYPSKLHSPALSKAVPSFPLGKTNAFYIRETAANRYSLDSHSATGFPPQKVPAKQESKRKTVLASHETRKISRKGTACKTRVQTAPPLKLALSNAYLPTRGPEIAIHLPIVHMHIVISQGLSRVAHHRLDRPLRTAFHALVAIAREHLATSRFTTARHA
jgi:hypothetical protein